MLPPSILASLCFAGLAGYLEIVFGTIVVGFEIGVARRPIGERAVLRDRGGAVALDVSAIVRVNRPRESATTPHRM